MPASIGVNLRVTGHCAQGGRRYMEDLFSVAYQQTEDERDLEYAFFGIYDGHGGGEAAAYAKEHLMDCIVKQRGFWSERDEDVLRAIRNGYMLTHLNMWKELDKWPKTVTGLPSTAGTTASIAFIRRGKIYIGHVGDSAIVLGYQKEGSEDWSAKPLTMDHKPESTTEMERIKQSGGKVIAKAGVPRVVWNRPRPGHKGPIKVDTPVDEIPFLAVARSLGDLWSYNIHKDEFVVSPDPDVGVLNIDTEKFRCLIFGTDGLWNMITPEAAVSLVQATERHNEAAVVVAGASTTQHRDWLNPSKSLVDNALERWSNTRMRADNTSVVTLMLDPPGPPRAAVLRSRNCPQRTPTGGSVPTATTTPQEKTEQIETTKTEVPSDTPVPQKGLKIVTRYTESALALASEQSPLPPCATLDSRFSIVPTDQAGNQQDASEHTTRTYGNPLDSYFITRLLSRTRINNTLVNIFNENTTQEEAREPSPPPLESTVECEPTAHSEEVKVEGLSVDSSSELPDVPETIPESEQSEEPPDDVESIQINEVSSSSPTDSAPKPRGRKPRSESQIRQPPITNGRTLRSHDAGTLQRPQTRLTATRGRSTPGQVPALERVVILSRARGMPVAPAVVHLERLPHPANETRPLTRKHNEPKTVAPPPDSRVKVIRTTRSRDANPLQPKMRIQSNSIKELRPIATRSAEAVVQLNRTGNGARAPGSRRNGPAEPRDRSETPDTRPEHSKENFTMRNMRRARGLRSHDARVSLNPPLERRRTRLCDKRDPLGALDVAAMAHPSLPLGMASRRSPVRPMRRCRTEEIDSEVHSTTGESEPRSMECASVASTELSIRPRALRSRNDAESTSVAARREVPTKRPPRALDDEHTRPGKTPKMMEKSLSTRVSGKRTSGPWSPGLALRNRLRKRLTK